LSLTHTKGISYGSIVLMNDDSALPAMTQSSIHRWNEKCLQCLYSPAVGHRSSHVGRHNVIKPNVDKYNKSSQSHLGRAASPLLTATNALARYVHVLLAAQCPLQTSPVTQLRARYIHTAVPHASYKLHCAVRFSPPSPRKRDLSLP